MEHRGAGPRALEPAAWRGGEGVTYWTKPADQYAHAGPLPELVTTGEAARRLQVRSINTVKRWVAEGLLVGYRIGGRVLVTAASVDAVVTEIQALSVERRER